MKKLIAILLMPVFLLMTAGVVVTSLYCKGKISEVGFSVKACCEDVNKGGCCNTETKVVKIEDSYVSTSITYDLNKVTYFFTISDFKLDLQSDIIHNSEYTSIWDKAPPLVKTELYILFRSLII